MELKSKLFSELDTKELFEIYKARVNVFVVEQSCPYNEVDDTDLLSRHIFLANEEGKILSYLRLFFRDENCIQIGRVLSVERGKGFAKEVMEAALKRAEELNKTTPVQEIYLEAQIYAVGFYEKFGFGTFGEEFLEDGIPHIRMRKKLKK